MKAIASMSGGILILMLALAGSAQASIVTFGLVVEYSGATKPAGSAPWLTAVFKDVTDGVNLKLTATNLSDNEFVSKWYFNLDPDFDSNPNMANYSFVVQSKSREDLDKPDIALGADSSNNVSGGHELDLEFGFTTSGKDDGVLRFGIGDSIEYLITGPSGLSASSFDVASANKTPGLFTVAHVQGIGEDGEDSGWVTTPEPATLVLLGLGGVGLALTRRRR